MVHLTRDLQMFLALIWSIVNEMHQDNLLLFVEKSTDGSRFIFTFKLKKSESRTPWSSRRWFLIMKNIELVNTGRLTERQARLNMERCAEFLARMIQKYGDAVLNEIEERNAQQQGK